ncbi:hypothetical protein J1605_011794 [Eschrichtius robustus]|uniref:Metastasis-associated protein MTA1 n=1 Tax=Eschrichtius robustus TaxID=9764 RepID=A0AB34GIZ5_ESCRO|nr:hypothetical protein J1605_011794 [Eschrichtius robustus]
MSRPQCPRCDGAAAGGWEQLHLTLQRLRVKSLVDQIRAASAPLSSWLCSLGPPDGTSSSSSAGATGCRPHALTVCRGEGRRVSSVPWSSGPDRLCEEDGRDQSKLETKVWEARNPLVDKQIDQFLVVARSVGTFARALDCSSSVRQPSLHMSAAAASRDITLFHAMDTLHRSVYDVAKAIAALVPQGGPVLCRDEMEEWSASEASLFEEALEKYGKDFTDIQQDFVSTGGCAQSLNCRRARADVVGESAPRDSAETGPEVAWKRRARDGSGKTLTAALDLHAACGAQRGRLNSGGAGTWEQGDHEGVPVEALQPTVVGGAGVWAPSASRRGRERPPPAKQGRGAGTGVEWSVPERERARPERGPGAGWGRLAPSRVGLAAPPRPHPPRDAPLSPQLPWKSLTSIIEYYYMWKTTDRYVQQKRLKAAEAESKLKQVYIPNYNKPNPNQISVNNVKAGVVNGAGAPGQSPGAGRACESCYTTQSYQWYSWGPPNMQCRLCASCWTYWKKYGGLKMPTRLDGERPGPNRSNMSPHGIPARSSGSPKFAMKTRQAFYLHTTKLTRIARRLCREILRPWHAARHPYMPINSAAIKAECTARLPGASQSPLVLKQAARKPLEAVLRHLETHPRPPKPDPVKSVSGVLSGLTPAKSAPVINNGSPTILGKRSYEQHNGVDGNVKKRLLMPSRDRSAAPRAPSSPTRCLLPWGLRLAGRPSFRAQRRSVDCPRSGSPGAPAARLYCLPSCCDCPHAASLSLCGRLRCACNPARAPAPVGGCGTLVPSGGRWDRAVAWGRHGWVGVGEARVDVRSGLANHGQTRHMGPSRNLLLNGKAYPTKVRLIRGGSLPPVKRRRMNWIDAPDDVFYMATEETRKIRKLLSSSETKRAARRPYKPIALRPSQALPLRPAPPAPVNDEPIIIED